MPLITIPAPTNVTQAWLWVLGSGALEIVFSVMLKVCDGFRRPAPTALALVSGLVSIWLMSLALYRLPLGTAYAVWAGIGTAGTALVGMLLWGESTHISRLASMALIVVGIVSLQLQESG